MKFSLRSFVFAIFLSIPFFVFAQGKYQYIPLLTIQTPGGGTLNSPNILEYLKNIYTFAIAIAGGLAVIKIVYGGIQYMLSDVVTNKTNAKNEITSAVIGLLVAFGSATLLYTINPALLTLNFSMAPTAEMVGDGKELFIAPLISNGTMSPGGGLRAIGTTGSGARMTAYGYVGDSTPDTNSSQRRGNHDNLLTEGSVALSPDIVASLQPQYGAAVYVGGTLVGYYDDQTASSYNGRQITNTVDRFDPTGSLGGNRYSESGGAITIDNNNRRTSASNPSP